MADLFQTLSGLDPDLLVLGWLALIAMHVFAIVRLMRRRVAARARREADALSVQSQTERAARATQKDTSRSQIERLFGILETSAASVERAMSAHRAAAKHLDSAEYQLLRLFDEFPILTASRSVAQTKPANMAVLPGTSPAPRAMAA